MSSGITQPYRRRGFWKKKENQFWNAPNSKYSDKGKAYLDQFANDTPPPFKNEL